MRENALQPLRHAALQCLAALQDEAMPDADNIRLGVERLLFTLTWVLQKTEEILSRKSVALH
jgi:hypothetical protein